MKRTDSTVSWASAGSLEIAETSQTIETAQTIQTTEGIQAAELQEEDWPRWQQPSKNPATAPWNIPISRQDYEKMLRGFEGRDISDRRDVKAMPRDPSSNVTLVHFARVTAETPDYTIVLHASSATGEEIITIVAIIWETIETLESLTGDEISEDYAKKEVVLVARCFLERELPGLPDLDDDIWWPKHVAWRNQRMREELDDDDNLPLE